MLHRTLIGGLVIVATVLGACAQPPAEPERLDFETDPRILRGVWEGENGVGESLVLSLEASSPTEGGYEITGLFQLWGGPDVAISGGVLDSVTYSGQTLAAQVSPVQPVCAVAAFPSNSAQDGDWELCGDAPTGSPPTFEMTVIGQNVPGGTATFSMTKRESDLADPNLLVSGNIVYVQGEPHTHPEPFEFTEDAHAVVQLWYSWSALGDGDVELVSETTIEDVTSFPLTYRLEGEAEAVFARQGDYYLNVGVFSGTGGASGEDFAVGDLTNEFYTPVPKPGAEVEIQVTGLESCDSPDAGGYCL